MKRMQILAAILLLALAAGVTWAGPRDDLWKQVDEAINKKGLPKTAIEILEQIIPGALADQAWAEATRAICRKFSLEGKIQGNKAEEVIVRLQAQVAQVPDPMKPVMEAILAHWYWTYFQQNRWRFVQRTQMAEPPGEDFTTWDLPRILAEIDKHFTLALADAAQLQATSIGVWDDLLEPGTMPDTYRPTLYDFLAFDALSFYNSGEQAGALPQDAFEIMADGPIFAPVAEFLQWRPETSDTESAKLKAVLLYQDLLTFHQNDKDRTAYLDADLQRLVFAKNQALGAEKATLYEAALERFVSECQGHELAAQGLAKWASAVHARGDYLRAHELAQQAWDTYPTSVGGILCYNLIQQIEARSASIKTERVWNEPLPDVQVTYRNVTRVFFRVVPVTFEAYAENNPSWNASMGLLNTTRAAPPALEWSADLPATLDYKSRTQAVAVPAGLAKGFYCLFASHDPSFQSPDNQISSFRFWVSDLALVVRHVDREGVTEGFVLDARTGVPITGAAVTRWKYESTRTGWHYRRADQTQSDHNGWFRFLDDGEKSKKFIMVAEFEGDRLATLNTYDTHGPATIPPGQERTIFFTDRSLYRPGQTVHYKGICLRTDPARDDYHTLAGRALTVIFRDVNNQEIARQAHQCNDYGSFSGSFTAPRDRLLGRMSLVASGGPPGSASVNVEEYKRPKFLVQLEAPTESARLNTEVSVPGRATAYTGAAIGGAHIEWRVVRQVRFPSWCWWAGWIPSSGTQDLAHGEAITESDGSFAISFFAKPDLSVSEKNEPIFAFAVYADVTDTTGETRSASRVVHVGYTTLQAGLSAAAWQTPDESVELTITTASVDGRPEPAAGKLQVYALKQPDKVVRAPLGAVWVWRGLAQSGEPLSDPVNPDTWETAELVNEQDFSTDAQGQVTLSVALKAGIYRAMLRTQDRFGKPVTARRTVRVVDPQAQRFGIRIANYFGAPSWSVEPGESFLALWGTGYDSGRAFVELECRGQVLRAWWTDPNHTQEAIRQDVTEDMRGGFTLRVTYVRENRAYVNQQIVSVPWTNKQLAVRWEHFRSLLEPGQKETWTAVITGPGASKAVAEMVAALYDASLDQYRKHDWRHSFSGFRSESSRLTSRFENAIYSFSTIVSNWGIHTKAVTVVYRQFPAEILSAQGHTYYYDGPKYAGRPAARGGGNGGAPAAPPAETGGETAPPGDSTGAGSVTEPVAEPGPDLSQVSARTNLDETAFFFPHLLSDAEGVVRMEFTMPEALTQWRFLGFAHDNALRSGFLTDTTVTAKDLMVEPNPPRFMREGDILEFAVKVTNMSAARQMGKVALTLADARTLESRDEALGNLAPEQDFDVPSKESRTYFWRLTVPDGCEMLTYKAVGATTRLSDGEQGYLPVLSRRILVIESLPLPIRGPQTKEFTFTKLLESGSSDTLLHQSLTVQMVSQPAWYAVMALPYLMEYPYECSEQVFNRLYANQLAAYIVNSDPKIRRIFEQWRNMPALDSPLEKNEDLKAVTLEETPWVRDALAESQARRNVGILFEQNRLNDETARALSKLQQMQSADGLWPWFPGFRGNEYVTLYITTGFGRLRHLGVQNLDVSCAVKALDALDGWMDRWYRDILRYGNKEQNNLNPTIAFYLYGRSFFLADKPIAAQYQEALNYWLSQARQYWLSQWRQTQAHLALGLKRFGDQETPTAIMQSIKEFSVTDEELGMYWRDTERSWWWHRAPIETQALMIEAFDEVMGDAQAVEDCRVWLLKQKQTQNWQTTKATADAVYGLLLRGVDMLASDAVVEVALGGVWIEPQQIEAGTGFYQERFVRNEIKPEMGQITVKKVDEGVSWGSVHWQYLEDMTKITPYEGTPLQLKKDLYIKKTTAEGPTLFPVNGPLSVGDELVVRIELRVDRDMEYVHMKDQRGSGTEPVNVLSRYRYQDGLGYYESTRDTATHFFMDYLSKGTYVFEYSTRIQHKGQYQTGIASIQCMYAPEFNSHSESFELEVQ